ncbi:MAG: DNA polymerase III subunit beta [Planctomycetes bacterium]|nr:DNA polymerase III subunit beta [Planctomycetota bacterium]
MKVLCHTKELQEAVNLVTGVVASNATRPILLAVYLRTDNGGLIVQGTDMEVGLSVRLDSVEISTDGDLAIPASRLHAILRETPDAEVSIEAVEDGNTAVIRCGASQFKVPVESASEFPRLDFKPPSPSIRVGRAGLLDMLKKVVIAAARDATRFQMHSVLFDVQGGSLRLVSTDGKRLAYSRCPIEVASPDGVEAARYLIPLKGVDLLMRILAAEGGDSVDLHLSNAEVTYNSDRISLSCRLIDGQFPDYQRALPSPGEYVYDMPCQELLVALRQASLMTTKETNSVQFKFDGDRLVLSTHATNLGESRIELGVTTVSAPEPEFSINFNPGYLIDLLKVQTSDSLRGSFKDRRTAGCFSVELLGDDYRHVVMPLVTQE